MKTWLWTCSTPFVKTKFGVKISIGQPVYGSIEKEEDQIWKKLGDPIAVVANPTRATAVSSMPNSVATIVVLKTKSFFVNPE